mgnify:CR=1 FL=1
MQSDVSTRLTSKLWNRANHFLELADFSLRRGFYDLSCFLALNAAKLTLVILNLVLCNRIPRANSLRHLLSNVTQRSNEDIKRIISEFVKRYRKDITRLESSGIELILSIETKNEKQAIYCIDIARNIMDLVCRILKYYGDNLQ